MAKEKWSMEYLKYQFTDDEKREISEQMAQQVSELATVEDELKAVKSDYKSRIDGLQANVNGAASKLNNGYEMRQIKVQWIPDWDDKIWSIMREDTGEIVKTIKMTQEDLQTSIPE